MIDEPTATVGAMYWENLRLNLIKDELIPHLYSSPFSSPPFPVYPLVTSSLSIASFFPLLFPSPFTLCPFPASSLLHSTFLV